jgi:hypothetical protein
MKRHLLLLLLFCSLLGWSQKKNHLQEMKLNGKVKYLKIYEYNDGILELVKEYFFNRQGNIERNNVYEKDKLISEFIYYFDKQGRVSSSDIYYYGDHPKEGRLVYIYDKRGNSIQEEYYENDKLQQYTQNKYDNDNHIILSTLYVNEKELHHFEFTYNDNNQLVEVKRFDSKNVLESILKNCYDSAGNLYESDTYSAKGKEYSQKMEYDEYNNITKDRFVGENYTSEDNYQYEYDSYHNYINKKISKMQEKRNNLENVYLKEHREIKYYE